MVTFPPVSQGGEVYCQLWKLSFIFQKLLKLPDCAAQVESHITQKNSLAQKGLVFAIRVILVLTPSGPMQSGCINERPGMGGTVVESADALGRSRARYM